MEMGSIFIQWVPVPFSRRVLVKGNKMQSHAGLRVVGYFVPNIGCLAYTNGQEAVAKMKPTSKRLEKSQKS